ncbi:hypothetical protein FRA_31c04450 [Francisella sp. W12-1067]|nr:hypothetical protein FRA_31c04450 [Francisella sp. W12-1067]
MGLLQAGIRWVVTRQKYSKKRSLHVVNEHFENVFNTVRNI